MHENSGITSRLGKGQARRIDGSAVVYLRMLGSEAFAKQLQILVLAPVRLENDRSRPQSLAID